MTEFILMVIEIITSNQFNQQFFIHCTMYYLTKWQDTSLHYIWRDAPVNLVDAQLFLTYLGLLPDLSHASAICQNILVWEHWMAWMELTRMNADSGVAITSTASYFPFWAEQSRAEVVHAASYISLNLEAGLS